MSFKGCSWGWNVFGKLVKSPTAAITLIGYLNGGNIARDPRQTIENLRDTAGGRQAAMKRKGSVEGGVKEKIQKQSATNSLLSFEDEEQEGGNSMVLQHEM